MSIDSLGKFFVEIKDDIEAIVNEKDKIKEIKDQRIKSLAFRVFGLIGVTFAAIITLSLAATFVLNPIFSTVLLVISVATLIVSYDHIVIGKNKRKLIKCGEQITSGSATNVVKGVIGGIQGLCREGKASKTGIPSWCEGTIVYKPVYKLFNKKPAAQTA